MVRGSSTCGHYNTSWGHARPLSRNPHVFAQNQKIIDENFPAISFVGSRHYWTFEIDQMSAPPKKKNPWTPMAAGCIAGGIEATCVWPMEFIKTQLQLQSKAKGAPLPYNGMISGLSYYVRTTGFLSLYRGLAPTLIGSIPKAGIRFGLNAQIKDTLRDKDGKLTPGNWASITFSKTFLTNDLFCLCDFIGNNSLSSGKVFLNNKSVHALLFKNMTCFL